MEDFEVHPPGTAAKLRAFPNEGHGHVRPRADGSKARCGGPGICAICSREAAAERQLERAPDGFAYRYPDGLRFNDGCEVNGAKPADVVPYWLEHAPRDFWAVSIELQQCRDRLANALRLLDDYRLRSAPFPTYEQLIKALQG